MTAKSSNKRVKVNALAARMNKSIGREVFKVGREGVIGEIRFRVPTGCNLLDFLLEGGYPCGRAIEIYGTNQVGKSHLAYYAMKGVQSLGGIPVLLDAEATFDSDRASELGVDLDNMIHIKPDRRGIRRPKDKSKAGKFVSERDWKSDDVEIVTTLTVEDGFRSIQAIASDIRKEYKNQDVPLLFVWDTLANSPTEASLLGRYAGGIAEKPRIISEWFEKIAQNMADANICLLMLNQIRALFQSYGPKTDSPGGHAFKHGVTYRLEVKRRVDEELKGQNVTVCVKKNKEGAPLNVINFYLSFEGNRGIDNNISNLNFLLEAVPASKKVFQRGGWINIKVKDPDGKDLELKFRKAELNKKVEAYPWLKQKLAELVYEYFV